MSINEKQKYKINYYQVSLLGVGYDQRIGSRFGL
jgi:hypothetical protein